MMELLEWLQVKSDLRPSDLAQLVSNVILFGYFIAYLINRKAIYIIVFFITELIAYSVIGDLLTDVMYYLVFAGVYSCLYHYSFIVKAKFNIVLACGIIVIFNTIAAGDAYFYPETETVFYQSYEFLVVGIHLYFISSLIDWKILRRALGQVFNGVTHYMGISYTASYFCYNIYNRN